MRVAYLDTSCLVAIAFGEPGSKDVAQRLRGFERLYSSNLLEAELSSALAREGWSGDATPLLSLVTWIHPNRPLTEEFKRVLALGYQRGADLWHLATALFLTPDPGQIGFLTLDRNQEEAAVKLGFQAVGG